MAGVLVIVWLGWLRTRQPGYLVLGAWALVAMTGMAINYLPSLQLLFGMPSNSNATMQLMIWLNLVRTVVGSILLLAGLGLLVFAPRRTTPQDEQ